MILRVVYLVMGLYKRAKLAQVGSSHGGKMHKWTLGQVQEIFHYT